MKRPQGVHVVYRKGSDVAQVYASRPNILERGAVWFKAMYRSQTSQPMLVANQWMLSKIWFPRYPCDSASHLLQNRIITMTHQDLFTQSKATYNSRLKASQRWTNRTSPPSWRLQATSISLDHVDYISSTIKLMHTCSSTNSSCGQLGLSSVECNLKLLLCR